MVSDLFSGAHYLLRFDDICPTMDWSTWDEVEDLLLEEGVKPILAVIPDNRDPKLMIDPPSPVFWERVRTWQARGWSIGLHGYQHTYVNREGGILRANMQSEFAGLVYQEQLDKLKKGLEIFDREGVRANAWVAPSHSFDWTTIAALKTVGITTVSDGIAFYPYTDSQGMTWVPQAFARMRPMPFGVYTYCYHLMKPSVSMMTTFRKRLKQLSPRMISLQEAERMANRRQSSGDKLFTMVRHGVYSLRRLLAKQPTSRS